MTSLPGGLRSLRRFSSSVSSFRPMLAESYGWFTDGFETADLQEAKALLDTLACAEGKASCEA